MKKRLISSEGPEDEEFSQMTNQPRSTVVGVFSDHVQADRAISELRRAGFRDDQIGIAGRHAEAVSDQAAATTEDSHAGTGALTGALAGAGLGGLVGLGIIAGIIPAIGPVIAGGTLAALLANAAGGAALGTLAGTLVGAGIPEEEAKYYHNEFEQGRTIVTVKADGRSGEATAILRNHGAYDMHSSGSSTVASTGSHVSTPVSGAVGSRVGGAVGSHAVSASHAERDQSIKVREEELHAEKRPVETGAVTVRKEVTTEHKTLDVPVRREEVVIERHPVAGQHVSAGEITEGQEVRIPVMEEQANVQKQAVVKEEVNVGKRVVQDTERVGGEVRKEHVRVEKQGDVEVHGSGETRRKP